MKRNALIILVWAVIFISGIIVGTIINFEILSNFYTPVGEIRNVTLPAKNFSLGENCPISAYIANEIKECAVNDGNVSTLLDENNCIVGNVYCIK